MKSQILGQKKNRKKIADFARENYFHGRNLEKKKTLEEQRNHPLDTAAAQILHHRFVHNDFVQVQAPFLVMSYYNLFG